MCTPRARVGEGCHTKDPGSIQPCDYYSEAGSTRKWEVKGGVPVLCVQKNKSEASEGTQAIGDWGVS